MRLLSKIFRRDDAMSAVHAPLARRAADDPERFARLVLDLDPRTALDPADAERLLGQIADALIAHERTMAFARRRAAEALIARLEHAVAGLELEDAVGLHLESAPEPIIDERQAAEAVARVEALLTR